MIETFNCEYAFLSNFSKSTIEFTFGGKILVAQTVEHAYQACKCTDFTQAVKVLSCSSPGKAKRAGRVVNIRPDWDTIKLHVMRSLLEYKFQKGSHLASLLKQTEPNELVEGNSWGDTYWGVCNGVGDNHLGKLLMLIRGEL